MVMELSDTQAGCVAAAVQKLTVPDGTGRSMREEDVREWRRGGAFNLKF